MMQVSLSAEAEAFIQQKIASGESADIVINRAIDYLRTAESQRQHWLTRELAKGEASGTPIPYTVSLLDEIEQEALAELEIGNMEIDPSVCPEATY